MWKSILAKFGYREWRLISMEVKPAYTILNYKCDITGSYKEEIEFA